MKTTRRQLRRIIKEAVGDLAQDPQVADIEELIYLGEFELADSSLQALGQDLPFLRGHDPNKAEGIPRDTYYDMYQPEVHDEYTAEETMVNCVRQGQHGPWGEQ